MNEGRAANATDAPLGRAASFEEFDAEYYALQYPDVAAVFGNDPMSLYTHYLAVGRAEGRAPSASAAAAASHSGSGSSEDNPYARFASSGSGSSHHSHFSSKSSSDESDEDEEKASGIIENTNGESGLKKLTCTYDESTHILTLKLGQALPSDLTSRAYAYVPYTVTDDDGDEYEGQDDITDTQNFEDTDDRQTLRWDISEFAASISGESETIKVIVHLYKNGTAIDVEPVAMTIAKASAVDDSSENDITLTEETATDVVDTNTSENEDGAETETLTSEAADENEEVSEEEETTEDTSATEGNVAANAVIAEAASDSEEEE